MGRCAAHSKAYRLNHAVTGVVKLSCGANARLLVR
jgi:hypothetical protein